MFEIPIPLPSLFFTSLKKKKKKKKKKNLKKIFIFFNFYFILKKFYYFLNKKLISIQIFLTFLYKLFQLYMESILFFNH
jgi:hypothetical protein